VYNGDIRDFIKKADKDLDLLKLARRADAIHISSPCQGFSGLNRTRDTGVYNDEKANNGIANEEGEGIAEDNRNQMLNKLSFTFHDFLRISDARVGVFENVSAMWSAIGMPYLRKLALGCLQLGYQVRVHILHTCDYGDPQRRPRLILVAAKDFVQMPSRPVRTHGPGRDRPWVTTKERLDFLRTPAAKERNFPNMNVCRTAPDDQEGCKQLDPHGLAPAVLASGPPVLHYEEKVPAGDGIDNDNEARRKRKFRCLSVRECGALQSFPHDYEFYGTMVQQYRQAGNAVPVHFARAIARSLRDSLMYLYDEELPEQREDAEAAAENRSGGDDDADGPPSSSSEGEVEVDLID